MDSPQSQRSMPKPLAWVALIVIILGLAIGVYFLLKQEGTNTNNGNIAVKTVANRSSSTNANANTNSTVDTSGWKRFDSTSSSLRIFRELIPAFSIDYPDYLLLNEQLGGLFISEGDYTGSNPSISVAWSDEIMNQSLIQSCKDHIAATTSFENLEFDREEYMIINGINSAYISYRLPDSYQPYNGRSDSVYVCIPSEVNTFFIVGRPRDAQIVTQYFDDVLRTFSIRQ